MGSLGSNQFALKEMFDAPIQEVFGQLCLLGSRYPLSPLTARLEPLTTHAFGIGSKWQEHRLHLFLRDIMECEVLQCKAYALSIVSNDGNCSAHITRSPCQLLCVLLPYQQHLLSAVVGQCYNRKMLFMAVHARTVGLQVSTSSDMILSSRKSVPAELPCTAQYTVT